MIVEPDLEIGLPMGVGWTELEGVEKGGSTEWVPQFGSAHDPMSPHKPIRSAAIKMAMTLAAISFE